MNKKRRLFLIDGSSYIYRAFHALPHFSNIEGLPTNAIYGFTRMLLKVLKDYKPEYLAVIFDSKGPTFRHEAYAEYKSNRPDMPDTLRPQLPFIREMVRAYNIPALELQGYEADDIIGTLAKRFKSPDIETAMVTSDKDMMQLVDEGTVILDTMKEKTCAIDGVIEKFGVGPEKVIDVMALAGDSSDNIPGVRGIGVKTAAKLIREFGALDKLYENIDRVTGRAVKEKLMDNEKMARLSLDLVTILTDVPIECALEDLSISEPDYDKLKGLFKALGFKSLLNELLTKEGGSHSLLKEIPNEITTKEAMDSFIKDLSTRNAMALSLNIRNKTGDATGTQSAILAISLEQDAVYYIRSIDDLPPDCLSMLTGILEDDGIEKLSNDAKGTYCYFLQRDIALKGLTMDTSIASYLLNPSTSDHTIETIAQEHLGIVLDNSSDDLFLTACNKAEVVRSVSPGLFSSMDETELTRLFVDIELPLTRTLAEMELIGIKVDKEYLNDFSGELALQLDECSKKIFSLAGIEFNINSPKQLAEILYERLGLKPLKRTKKGSSFSTNEETLLALSKTHDLPNEILVYRHLNKLKSTYVDALLELKNPETDRVHTSFNQTVTATGRLSSSQPNLQNIPIKTDMGRRIREAFISEEGCLLISADYSQIELRLVAHLSGDEILIDAFNCGEDIHARTAGEVFGIMPGLVTKEMRRQAKSINFGIIYGMGAYGLARDLGISKGKAKEYIENYFERYKGVHRFIEKTIQDAKNQGYTTTLFGRRRQIPELMSGIETMRKFGERIAVNTPIQGTAADIIKVAMLNIERRIDKERLSSRMLLQIHDELIVETPKDEIDLMKRLIKEEMEGVVDLVIPIEVHIGTGRNWREAGH